MREVKEEDFRKEEFRDAKVEDYEFRSDGAIVRKDRWEMGIRNIASAMGLNRAWEVEDVVGSVKSLVNSIEKKDLPVFMGAWQSGAPYLDEFEPKQLFMLKNEDGDFKQNVTYDYKKQVWLKDNVVVEKKEKEWKWMTI